MSSQRTHKILSKIQQVLLSIVLISQISIGYAAKTDGRIVGGRPALEGEFPYQVSLRRSYNDNHFCGGTIITPIHILTAAHCMYYVWGGVLTPDILTVVAGQLKLELTPTSIYRNASKIFIHPNYNKAMMINDIAIIELKQKLPLNKLIRRIDLNQRVVPANLSCIVSGWGVQSYDSLDVSNELLATQVDIVDHKICQNRYDKVEVVLFKGMMCAANEQKSADACQGDSGGPLACYGVLTGVISTGSGCGDKEYPGIYSDVRYFLPWIQNTTSYKLNKELEKPTIIITNTSLINNETTGEITLRPSSSHLSVHPPSHTSENLKGKETTLLYINGNNSQLQFLYVSSKTPSKASTLKCEQIFVIICGISLIFDQIAFKEILSLL